MWGTQMTNFLKWLFEFILKGQQQFIFSFVNNRNEEHENKNRHHHRTSSVTDHIRSSKH
jgi:hypothetical protein